MENLKRFRSIECNYCGKPAKVVRGGDLYGPNHHLSGKYFYCCKDCDAWVGMHEGSFKPFGTLANASLRKKRLAAHKVFDPLWSNQKKPVVARREAYLWLANKLNIPVEKCHIGMFDSKMCDKVIRFCLLRKKGII